MALIIDELTVDTVNWTPYSPPDDCNVISFYNKDTTSDLKFRKVDTDPTTEVLIPAGIEKQWGHYALPAQTSPRYPKNVIIGYLQAVAGTGPVKIEGGR